MASETIFLVPHTHWDREWYEPFQRFRLRLVDLLDDVTVRATGDPDFHFTLDGQLAAVDDYLEVRPEATDRIVELVRSGQFAIGPWAILLDEFLCSGENIVRNLELGLRRAADFGGAMPVGYLPDMFGHAAQMPQILAGAGLRQACVFRGVPAGITFHAFRWEAPDGTAVRTEYLPGGYGNAAELFEDPDNLAAGAAGHVDRLRSWYGDDPVLGMYGTDHSAPLPGLSASVAAVNAAVASGAAGVGLRMCTLADYLALFDPDDTARLPVWRGELRSHARANILPGVLSNRPHLKQGLSHAERMVERYAEPLTALWTPASRWPGRLLEMAWRRLIESSCHDSVTGCGVDETAVQVAARIAEAEQIGRGVLDRTLAALATTVPAGSMIVANPSPRPRTGLVRVTVAAGAGHVVLRTPDGTAVPTQQASKVDDAPLYSTLRTATDLAAALRKGALGLEFLALPIRDVALGAERELLVTLALGGGGLTAAHRSLAAAVAAAGGNWRVRVVGVPTVDLFAAVPVPALGWTTVTPVPVGSAVTASDAVPGATRDGVLPDGTGRVTVVPAPAPAAGAGAGGDGGGVGVGVGATMSNGRLHVSVDDDGTLTLSGPELPTVSGVGRLVDGGDVGDLYNYAPPERDTLVEAPDSVRVRVRYAGPLVGVLEVRRRYRWAGRTDGTVGRSAGGFADGLTGAPLRTPAEPAAEATTDVLTEVELRSGEPFCRLTVSFENRHADHRVRLHVPLPQRTDHSHAEGQFAVVRRGLTSEGGHGEVPLPTFPAYSFVDAGGMAVLLDQVSEYELVTGDVAGPGDVAGRGDVTGPGDVAGRGDVAGPGDVAGRGDVTAPGDPMEVAVTLLRATGLISRAEHPLRAEPAGPVIATPQAQCIGQVITTRLAVMPHRDDWATAGVPAAAEDFRLAPVTVATTGQSVPAAPFMVDGGAAAAGRPMPGSGLSVQGAGVTLTSLRRRDADWLEVRLVALTDRPTVAVLGTVSAARRADLTGRPGEPLSIVDGELRMPLRPWQIATVQVLRKVDG